MATARFARVDVNKFLKYLEGVEKSVIAVSEDIQIEAAMGGAERMQELIEQRGTGRNPWGYRDKTGTFRPTPMRAKESPRRGTLRSGSQPGRVNTGNMRDSVGFRFETGRVKRVAAFGWIRSNSEDLEYFMAQELGFAAGGFRAPQKVNGMFALRDARLYVTRELLPRLIRKYQNRIARGNYR
jgi:hypothetical protein